MTQNNYVLLFSNAGVELELFVGSDRLYEIWDFKKVLHHIKGGKLQSLKFESINTGLAVSQFNLIYSRILFFVVKISLVGSFLYMIKAHKKKCSRNKVLLLFK